MAFPKARNRLVIAALTAILALALALTAFMLLRAEESPEPALSWPQLSNATYSSEFPRSKQAPLTDVVYD